LRPDVLDLFERDVDATTRAPSAANRSATARPMPIRAITEEFGEVKLLVEEVNQGSQEQTRGIEEVAKAVLQMQQVTQTAAAGAEESAAAAEELNAQSASLKNVVERLSAMMGGGQAANGGAGQTHHRSSRASAPRRQGESSEGLGAPRKAVSHNWNSEQADPVFANHNSDKGDFPMD
jgi:uncharacterized phage infection (PIP) family protein YhgE